MKKLCLHLACGPVYLKSNAKETWINIDIKGELAKDRPDLVKINSTDIEHYFKKPYIKNPFGSDKRGKIVVDRKADVRDLGFFENESTDVIFSVNLIDHLKFQDISQTLKEWHRILKPNGILIIDVGNAIDNAKMLLKAKTKDDIEWALRLIYCHSRDKYDSHHWGYFPKYLKMILKENGFSKFQTKRDFIKHVYPSFQLFAKKI